MTSSILPKAIVQQKKFWTSHIRRCVAWHQVSHRMGNSEITSVRKSDISVTAWVFVSVWKPQQPLAGFLQVLKKSLNKDLIMIPGGPKFGDGLEKQELQCSSMWQLNFKMLWFYWISKSDASVKVRSCLRSFVYCRSQGNPKMPTAGKEWISIFNKPICCLCSDQSHNGLTFYTAKTQL